MSLFEINEVNNSKSRMTVKNYSINDISFPENNFEMLSSKLDKTNMTSDPTEIIQQDYNYLLEYRNYSNIQITFVKTFNLSMLKTIKKHFLSLFKVIFPEEFFEDVYKGKYYSIIGIDNETKDVICFSHIDINKLKRQASILTFGVVKEYQRKKFGTKCLNKIIEELLMMGVKEVKLIVQELNERGVKLFLKNGFYIEKEIEGYYNFIEMNEYKGEQVMQEKYSTKGLLMKKDLLAKANWMTKMINSITSCFG